MELRESVPLGMAGRVQADSLVDASGTVIESRTNATFDVYENRLLKRFVGELMPGKLREMGKQIGQEIQGRQDNLRRAQSNNWHDTARYEAERITALEAAQKDTNQMQSRVQVWADESFLRQVGKFEGSPRPTPAFTKDPNYSRFYRIYLAFQRDLRIADFSQFVAALSVQVQSELYEIWAVFSATLLLRELLEDVGYLPRGTEKFYKIKNDTFQIEVDGVVRR